MYINYKLAINKENFNPSPAIRGYAAMPFECDLSEYLALLKRVGEPWGWDRRPKYSDDIDGLKKRFEEATIYSLTYHHKLLGYCMSVPRLDLSKEFSRNVGEIENFGLFPQHNAKGHGGQLLPLIFADMFKKYEMIHLETRSTNHPKVIPFYEKLGMAVFAQEEKEDDLRIVPPVLD